MSSQISILRELRPDVIAQRRRDGDFFWADLDLEGDLTVEKIAEAFELDVGATAALGNFTKTISPSRKVHVDADLIVFRFWCMGRPDAPVLGGIDAIEPFQVNVVVHGDYLLTVHRLPYDVPGEVTDGRIPPGRSERYAVYLALDGMVNTILETLANTEQEVGEVESDLLQRGVRPRAQEKRRIGSLRDRLTGLRMRIGPQRGLFERVNAIIATIFLPLGFIVGFFGMNFDWLIDRMDSEGDFFLLGIALWLVPLGIGLAYLALRDFYRRPRPD